MLNIENILWVIPGLVFILLHNKNRSLKSINLNGWPYIFFLVVIAAFTWIPANLILKNCEDAIGVVIVGLLILFSGKYVLEKSKNVFISLAVIVVISIVLYVISNYGNRTLVLCEYIKDERALGLRDFALVILSVLFAILLYILNSIRLITSWLIPESKDNFYRKCIGWEKEIVVLILKNESVYKGILWKYPENPQSSYEFQALSIIPLQIGYIHPDTKKIQWTTDYYNRYFDSPEVKERLEQWFRNCLKRPKSFQERLEKRLERFLEKRELVIPRSEVVIFKRFDEKIDSNLAKEST